MTTNIVIDPVTRIEGHLRIEAKVDGSNTVTEAYSSSTMARGIEIIMQGRDPRDACHISQRICGVCTVVHGLTSVRAVENALGVTVPENAELIRNMMIGAQYIHDHVMHFYHLHALDWVDVVSALSASSSGTASLAAQWRKKFSNYPVGSSSYYDGIKTKLKALLDRGQLGLFANGYWGHPEYRLAPEANLLAVDHYIQALGWAREVVKLHTIFGGKDPHPNLVVGGVPCSVSDSWSSQASEDRGGTSLNSVNMAKVSSLIKTMQNFVNNVYLPDTVLIASQYKSGKNPNGTDYLGWEKRGGTGGNYLCYGEFAETKITDIANLLIPQGVITSGIPGVQSLDMVDTNDIQEFVAHAWYRYDVGNNLGLHPSEGETVLDYNGRGGPAPGYNNLDTDKGYSWIKSPRWRNQAMEVGPLAHVLMMYTMHAKPPQTDTRNSIVKAAHKQAYDLVQKYWVNSSTGLGIELKYIHSTLGRIAARTIETAIIAGAMPRWQSRLLSNINAGKKATFITDAEVQKSITSFEWKDPSTWTNGSPIQGVGFTEAPRGALGHWLSIEGGKVKNYQCIVASQWNAGPRDAAGRPGPYEKSLEGHTLVDPKQPLEILRTIHSFDPCIGCAVHVTDPNGEELIKVNVSTTLR